MSSRTYHYLTRGTSILATSGAVGVMAGAVAASVPVIVTSGVAIGGAALANILVRPSPRREKPADGREKAAGVIAT